MQFQSYDPGDFYDELFIAKGQPRPEAALLIERINALSMEELQQRRLAAQNALFKLGVTFNVYSDNQGTERIFPFDIIPRILPASEWEHLNKGLKQRIQALNLFLADIYSEQKILTDGVIPRALVESATGFLKPCIGLKPPQGIWCHITGTDLVRDRDGQWYVLEDNLRCPSGVSYVLQNRQLMKQTFPQLFEFSAIRAVDDYCSRLLDALQYLRDEHMRTPSVALLSPGSL
ncbi:MAG: hypothetical protein HC772_17695 [Leptolyngbyaceae cyanobacterium CRU_2_3]|nr:hypothetical protein [Leptolyngbyaceae cyanobacterium CRU_2_3]